MHKRKRQIWYSIIHISFILWFCILDFCIFVKYFVITTVKFSIITLFLSSYSYKIFFIYFSLILYGSSFLFIIFRVQFSINCFFHTHVIILWLFQFQKKKASKLSSTQSSIQFHFAYIPFKINTFYNSRSLSVYIRKDDRRKG